MSAVPDFATFLNDAIGIQSPGGATYGSGTRQAMVFSSRYRQITRGAFGQEERDAAAKFNASLQAEIARRAEVEAATARLNEAIGTNVVTRPFDPLPEPKEIMDDTYLARAGVTAPSIAMAINANSVTFSQGKRITEKKTREGSVFFHFTNKQGQNNDILRLTFRGNTGNIDRRGSLGAPERDPFALKSGTAVDKQLRGEQDTGALRKLLVWHNLYALTREPMLLSDGSENKFYITYISALFPFALIFEGFYNNVLELEENAEKPNSRDYAFEFVVSNTRPSLDEVMVSVASVYQQLQLREDTTATIAGSNVGVSSP
jgi:hypothetical protein